MRNNEMAERSKSTYLFKLGLIIEGDGVSESASIEMIKLWLDSRFSLHEIQIANHLQTEVRTIANICNVEDLETEKCDGLICLVPPGSKSNMDVDINIPIMTIRLEDSINGEDYDSLLLSACQELFDSVLQTTDIPIIEKISLPKLVSVLLTKTIFSLPNEEENLQNLPHHLQRKAFDKLSESALNHCFDVIHFAAKEIPGLISSYKNPTAEFSEDAINIMHYFSDYEDLPCAWKDISKQNVDESKIPVLFPKYTKEASFKSFLHDLLENAPSNVHHRCNSLMNAHNVSKCIKVALASFGNAFSDDHFPVYLPIGSIRNIIDLYLKSIPQSKVPIRQQSTGVPVDQDILREVKEVELQYISPMTTKQFSPIRSPLTAKRILQINNENQRKRAKTEVMSDDMKQCKSFTTMLQQAVMSDTNLINFINADPTLAALMSELSDDSKIKKM
jgi:hypothetical protein